MLNNWLLNQDWNLDRRKNMSSSEGLTKSLSSFDEASQSDEKGAGDGVHDEPSKHRPLRCDDAVVVCQQCPKSNGAEALVPS